MAEYTVRIDVRVYDDKALFEAAFKHAVEVDDMGEIAAREQLMDGDDVDVSACLQMIFDPGQSPDGTEIIESSVE